MLHAVFFTDDPARAAVRAVEAIDTAAVTAHVEADPFWPTGLRRSVRILEWRRVFADGEIAG